ncbi:hypothetical protein L1987_03021 [Smallanthus sonchifolius]|uniref:Uncharacterized protein n=1 Tax=Smallanthus sonchifolius TaxID=185202 RepID=A0ACB9K9M1_9ASTR|nr:hypothetical protein L1987_03021 [Smallanthus sonchifolius]
MEPRDTIIDGGNEWYENTERRNVEANNKGLLYLEMGVSGGEEGARNGNFVKMVHNGIEYGDMQLISEAYDVLKNVGGLSGKENHKDAKIASKNYGINNLNCFEIHSIPMKENLG